MISKRKYYLYSNNAMNSVIYYSDDGNTFTSLAFKKQGQPWEKFQDIWVFNKISKKWTLNGNPRNDANYKSEVAPFENMDSWICNEDVNKLYLVSSF